MASPVARSYSFTSRWNVWLHLVKKVEGAGTVVLASLMDVNEAGEDAVPNSLICSGKEAVFASPLMNDCSDDVVSGECWLDGVGWACACSLLLVIVVKSGVDGNAKPQASAAVLAEASMLSNAGAVVGIDEALFLNAAAEEGVLSPL